MFKTVFGAKFDLWRLLGLVVGVSLCITLFQRVLSSFFPEKRNASLVTATELLEVIVPRMNYSDSVYRASAQLFMDSLNADYARRAQIDSAAHTFYTNKQKNEHERVNRINAASDDELYRIWAARYGK